METRVGIGFDVHRFAAGRPLVLGGCPVPHRRGLEGHSDADVLCHAVMDALLGAVADGDIGRHFPDTDRRWKGARSVELLAQVAARLAKRRARIGNVDVTILAEEPRIAPHVAAMRANLGKAMGIAVGRVSIKATTMERMGTIGRREGIAAMAVATVIAVSRRKGKRA